MPDACALCIKTARMRSLELIQQVSLPTPATHLVEVGMHDIGQGINVAL